MSQQRRQVIQCRSPCGERGLKFDALVYFMQAVLSLPMRGAWIEIAKCEIIAWVVGRSPCGERGLKLIPSSALSRDPASLPMRGAWIEILQSARSASLRLSLPMRGAWIEIERHPVCVQKAESLPMRGAWIEISICASSAGKKNVAPHAGSVD